jgi:hypothetical protein
MLTIAAGILIALFVIYVVLPLATLFIAAVFRAIAETCRMIDGNVRIVTAPIDRLAGRLHLSGPWLVGIVLLLAMIVLMIVLARIL